MQQQRRKQQANAQAVGVGREGDLLDHQRTPGVEQNEAGRCDRQQQPNERQVDADQQQLQRNQAARSENMAGQKGVLGGRPIDCGQVRVVDLVEQALKRWGNARVGEGLGRGEAVGRAGLHEPVAIPEVAEPVVLEQRHAERPAQPEQRRPDHQPYNWQPIGRPPKEREDHRHGQ